MEFTETKCEKCVLQHLGLPTNEALPFGIMLYIHSACHAGFYSQEIATSAARLLRWSSIFKKIKDTYPSIDSSEAAESDLKGAYLKYGSGSKFVNILAEYLVSSQRYTREVKLLRDSQTKEQRSERQRLWGEMIKNTPSIRSLPFTEEIKIDVELFGMLLSEAEKQLTAKATQETELARNEPSAYRAG